MRSRETKSARSLAIVVATSAAVGAGCGSSSRPGSSQGAGKDAGADSARDATLTDGTTADGPPSDSAVQRDSAGANDSTSPGDSSTGPVGFDAGPEASSGVDAAPASTSAAASFFPSNAYFNQPVDTASVDLQSGTILSNLVANGGWGLGHVQIDFSIDIYYANASSTYLPFVNGGVTLPDSDIPMTVPVDPGSAAGFESSTGKTCDGGDCHYLVMDTTNGRLIEVDMAQADNAMFTTEGGSVAIWSFTKAYPASLRGDVCTSADASGGMMAPLLFTAEEVAAGHIDHAIRFILPNTRIQFRQYVRPATHGTGAIGPDGGPMGWAASGGVPYGARFRLHSNYDASGLSAGAQVVAAGLKKYGMILSDGGNIALTAKSDQFSTTKWASLLGSHDLSALQPTDFDMVDASYGTDQVSSSMRFNFTSFDCVRNP